MFKLFVVFGTRPEAIKLAPLILQLKQLKNLQTVVIDAGQHKELSEPAIRGFSLQIDYSLHIMKPDQSLCDLTIALLKQLTNLIDKEKPNLVIVQGDTTTAFISSLAAYYSHIPIAHVEAGLHSMDKYQPFPEEFNRQSIDVIADWYFAPDQSDATYLLAKGCPPAQVFVVGNTIVDALLHILNDPHLQQTRSKEVRDLEALSKQHKLVVITSHRRENFGKPLQNICEAILKLAQENKEVYFLFSVHLNPHVRETVYSLLSGQPNILLHAPFDYTDFVFILSYAYCILTDSGGIQEEAAFLEKPLLILRETTERHDGVKAGIAKLIGTDPATVFTEANQLLNDPKAYANMHQPQSKYIYGDGKASKQIVDILAKAYSFHH